MTITNEVPKEGFKALVQYGTQPVYFFRFDTEETEDDTIRCKEATIMCEDATYDKMVSLCIGVKYTLDAQMALLYNYQSDPDKYAADMAVYQSWREYCKDACSELRTLEP